MQHAGPLIIAIVGSIVLAAILGLLAHRLRISPLVGYLIAGIIFGQLPGDYTVNNDLLMELAEIGVILLMFGVGLHFSLSELMLVKNIAIPGAIVQIAVATLLGMGLSYFLGWTPIAGFIFGLCLSTASTVVLLRALQERQLLESKRGQIAIGWLIVEDLVMVLVLVLLPVLVNTVEQTQPNFSVILVQTAKTIGLVVTFIFLMVIFGSRITPWLLARSARTGSDELFTLTVLAIALGFAFLASQIFGASFALGAFFAGIVLNSSELSHRAARDTLPLRDAFAVLFFVSVGMLFKPGILLSHPFAVIVTLIIIIFGKSLAAYLIVRLFGHSKRTALTIAVSLAQIGEFAYILAALGMMLANTIDPEIFSLEAYNLILAGSIISIVLNPIIFSAVEHYLGKTETIVDQFINEISPISQQLPDDITDHTIIIGHGTIGEVISQQLRIRKIPTVIIDSSLIKVEELKHDDYLAICGDASDQTILDAAKLQLAKWVIISMPNSYKAAEIVTLIRKNRPDIEIYVRAFYDDGLEYIEQSGATHVITGEAEIAARFLSLLNLEPVIITEIETEKPLITIDEKPPLPGNGSPI